MVTSLLVTRKCNICPIPDRFWVRFNIKILSNQYIGRSHDRLIFINGSPKTWNDGLHVETEPRGQVLFLSLVSWWRHQMKTFSALLALCTGNSPLTGEFPSKRPATWSFYVFFDLHLSERRSKQSRRRGFETPSGSLWRHCNGFLT